LCSTATERQDRLQEWSGGKNTTGGNRCKRRGGKRDDRGSVYDGSLEGNTDTAGVGHRERGGGTRKRSAVEEKAGVRVLYYGKEAGLMG